MSALRRKDLNRRREQPNDKTTKYDKTQEVTVQKEAIDHEFNNTQSFTSKDNVIETIPKLTTENTVKDLANCAVRALGRSTTQG